MSNRILLACLCLSFGPGRAAEITPCLSSSSNQWFISEVWGGTATLINPAALATSARDDGLWLSYAFIGDEMGSGDKEFGFSIGNLGFGFQNYDMRSGNDTLPCYIYRIGLSVGGRLFSLGTSQNLTEIRFPSRYPRLFTLDAGFVCNPLSVVRIAGLVRNVDDNQHREFRIKREYIAGFMLRFVDAGFRLLAQAAAHDRIRGLDEVSYRYGISAYPLKRLGLTLMSLREPHAEDHFAALLSTPLIGGVSARLGLYAKSRLHIDAFSISCQLPLQTGN